MSRRTSTAEPVPAAVCTIRATPMTSMATESSTVPER